MLLTFSGGIKNILDCGIFSLKDNGSLVNIILMNKTGDE